MAGGLHPLDLAILAGYTIALIVIGKRAAKSVRNREDFFLAGRKLGKLYQFLLSFAHTTEPQGAVNTASFVFQQGASGC